MGKDVVFRFSYDAHLAACFDLRCLQKSGYKLKKYVDGYRYYPIGSKHTYVIRNPQVIEVGQHVSTYYWSGQRNSRNRFNCLVIPFKKVK